MPQPCQELVLRPPGLSRGAGWVFVIFGTLFGSTPLAVRNEPDFAWSGGALLIVSGLFFAGFGVSLSCARAVVSPRGVRYRYGLVRRSIPASEIEDVVRGRGSGAYYSRTCLHICCRGRRRPVRLIGLQRADTANGRAIVEESASQVRSILGLDAA